ncbi:hypothetical protein PUN28_006487 [Cardiocondyla obscurior]|uniref:Uncharacterized protein n=1 Tax=Cardiocondyla obscurior TaxID=286306 RepID=A0AAW2G8V6_9HYME
MRVTSAQAAATRSSERLDPHKRSTQLDFLEKIPSAGMRLPRGDSHEEEEEEEEAEVAAKTESRMKQMRRRRKTASMKNEGKARMKKGEEAGGRGGGRIRSNGRRIRRFEGRIRLWRWS